MKLHWCFKNTGTVMGFIQGCLLFWFRDLYLCLFVVTLTSVLFWEGGQAHGHSSINLENSGDM